MKLIKTDNYGKCSFFYASSSFATQASCNNISVLVSLFILFFAMLFIKMILYDFYDVYFSVVILGARNALHELNDVSLLIET